MKIKSPTVPLIVFSVIFLVVGIGILLWGITTSQTALRSQQWPTVPGTVTAAQVKTSTSRSSTTRRTTTHYSGHITYIYRVNGQDFTATQVSFADYSSSDRQHASEIVNRYPAGRAVTVSYNPQNPAQAVLEPGFGTGLYIPLGIGTVFILAGGGMLAGGLQALWRGSEEAN